MKTTIFWLLSFCYVPINCFHDSIYNDIAVFTRVLQRQEFILRNWLMHCGGFGKSKIFRVSWRAGDLEHTCNFYLKTTCEQNAFLLKKVCVLLRCLTYCMGPTYIMDNNLLLLNVQQIKSQFYSKSILMKTSRIMFNQISGNLGSDKLTH